VFQQRQLFIFLETTLTPTKVQIDTTVDNLTLENLLILNLKDYYTAIIDLGVRHLS
jgi:hypothetical protein